MSFFERKKVPRYWWDFDKDYNIIVESDCDKYPVVGLFTYEGESADGAIAQAEQLIADLTTGRKTPKSVIR